MMSSVELDVDVPPLLLLMDPLNQHVDEGGRVTISCTAVQVSREGGREGGREAGREGGEEGKEGGREGGFILLSSQLAIFNAANSRWPIADGQ